LRKLIEQSGASISATVFLDNLTQPKWSDSKAKQSFRSRLEPFIPQSKTARKAADALLNRLILRLPDAIPKTWSDFDSYAQKVVAGKYLPELAKALQQAEVVFINGEGGIFGNRRESRMMLYIAYLAKRFFAKPVVLANHTAELNHPVLSEMARQVYPLLDDVVFREAMSAEHCAEFVSGRVAPDVSFAYTPAPYEAWQRVVRQGYYHHWPEHGASFDPSQPYLCLGGSSSYGQTSYDPKPGFIALCKRLRREFGQVVLTASATTDEAIFSPIARDLDLPLIPLSTSALQAVDVLGNARAYIGGRWHGGIFALSGGTPIIPLSAETFKIHALVKQFDLETPVFNALDLEGTEDSIIAFARKYLAEGEMLRNKLQQKAALLAQETVEHVRFIAERGQMVRAEPIIKMPPRATPPASTALPQIKKN
jgi:hypothetical protein